VQLLAACALAATKTSISIFAIITQARDDSAALFVCPEKVKKHD
jgi:hypothetical protein